MSVSITAWPAEVAQAFLKVQGGLKGALKDAKNPHLNSKYADLASCWEACKEALQTNGFAVSQMPVNMPDRADCVSLATTLAHTSGWTLTSVYSLKLKDGTNPQNLGSTITYMRRYALCGLLGICPEDDDGHAGKEAASKPSNSPTKAASKLANPNVAEALEAFQKLTVEQQKAKYTEAKNAAIAEPIKTQLLSSMAGIIKEINKWQQ